MNEAEISLNLPEKYVKQYIVKMALKYLKDYYEVLGIGKTASSSEIRSAYMQEIRKCHPDKYPGNSRALYRFQELTEAYSILGNLDNRLKYGLMLDKKKQILKHERKQKNKVS